MLPSSLLAFVAALPTVVMAAALPELPHDVSEGGIKWTGKIFKDDKKPTVLYGEIEDILDQILALNPNYVASEVNPDPETAQSALQRRVETLTCATMATGGQYDITAGADHLVSVGAQCETPAKQCRRMTCKNTTGSYLCSEGNNISLSCNSLARIVRRVNTDCCNGKDKYGSNSSGKSGHIYNDRIWSVWVGYGNCGHSSSSRPTDYPYPGGSPNGVCQN
ncbi:hypothetical protein QBC38DRAFT_525498 [Podospora fimiseda]|uniref:Secreted protein n=1 Tax=Podospora fimiseda TaxID=252190 RepID=A0AAN6YLM1_9PEZI|nr:hypothetical protein QBC38DRAFT_525498 [Podospora fimiseda]